jgi:hypothetical protein
MASTLNWPERGFIVEQTTDYPTDPSGTVRLTLRGDGYLRVKLRVPYWVEKDFVVRVGGVRQQLRAVAGSYVTVSRRWKSGDTIDISMPFTLRMERTLDQPQTQCITYGPIPLVVQSPTKTYLELGFYKDYTLAGDLSRAIQPTGAPLTFTTNGYTLAPFYNGDTAPYHVYFHRAEPEVVFGAVDAGVPNRAGDDGLTFLDALWAEAPFAGHGHFRGAVARLAGDWQRRGVFSAAERDAIVAAAKQANLEP